MDQDEQRHRRSRLFTVRIWTESVTGGLEHRGSVRDVSTGAFRSFRDWSDLTSFLADQVEGDSIPKEHDPCPNTSSSATFPA